MNRMKMAERLQKSPDKIKMVKAAFKQLDPVNFAFVMASGALSLSFQLLGWGALAKLFLFFGLVGFIFIGLLFGVGFYMSRETMKEGFNLEGLFKYFAFSTSAGLLGASFGWMGYGIFAIFFGAIGVLSTIFLVLVLFYSAFTQQTSSLQKLSPVWLFLPVACNASSLAISSVAKTYEITDPNLLLTSAVFWSFGLFLYLLLMALNLYRVFANAIRTNELSPSFWLWSGAAALIALDGNQQILLKTSGINLLLWGVASAWIPILLTLLVAKYLDSKTALQYEPPLWAIVFSLAIYTAVTPLSPWLWLSVAAWLVVSFLVIREMRK